MNIIISQTSGNKENETAVKLEDFDLDIKVLPADSIGTVYMEVTYTNNSDEILTGY
ncbi:hypothetical protein [Sarcina ventriculi]|uniref:hypothetical protein n=1 Tax=Sarcina ventriculi TaxID=1267 RepID=UPI001C12639D|nr:hypothetical protein [Sarcina ventriculi]MBU5323415.1 hypothetical protein [Sarcina ventriculi]